MAGMSDDKVRAQYEELPYPPRDPSKEREQLRSTLLGHLNLVNHVAWGGGRRPGPGFRILDAGCGTGDNTVFLAEVLRDTGVEVVGFDLSSASLDITRKRLAARGLDKTRLVQGRIEDLPSMDLGLFDYVISAGVLHHLPSPEAGLAAVTRVLKPHGVLGAMLYGLYGRAAIYQLQALLRIVAPDSQPTALRLKTARAVLAGLRPDHWASFARNSWSGETDDAGLFDLLLHSTDRGYSVLDIHRWLESAGLSLLRFHFAILYQPEIYLDTLDYQALSAPDRQAAAELLNGRMMKHTFLASFRDAPAVPAPAWDDENAVPTFLNYDTNDVIRQQIASAPALNLQFEDISYSQPLERIPRALLRRIDGKKTLGAILAEVRREFSKISADEIRESWRSLEQGMSSFGLLGSFPASPAADV